jgi:hypothetical protein
MKTIAAFASISMIALAASPALAQTAETSAAPRSITGYGTLGYSHSDRGVSDLGGATGRLGLRFGKFVGAEAEGTWGVTDDDSVNPRRPAQTKLERSMAAYAVGYAPVTDRLDLIGRVGIGNTRTEMKTGATVAHQTVDSINYGAGAQYFLTEKDGLRADFTRESYRKGPGHADTYGVSYVRKF